MGTRFFKIGLAGLVLVFLMVASVYYIKANSSQDDTLRTITSTNGETIVLTDIQVLQQHRGVN
ncbi:hypothetical protein LZ11_01090 [Thermosediminibacter litoriperuensis]|uniref:Uncharacterized protein n=1 Tax=Thermosediminibacter litoriperuensis TaxID=291989 RepID=A0A5S5AVU7_9FIRM|nr:hypothetical protein LZ11_01090 [Thermosediminibacter litoriperuensis]